MTSSNNKTAFEDFFPSRQQENSDTTERLGVVVGGSLSKGLDVKLDRQTMIEGVNVGRYVVIRGAKYRFFGMITDIALDSANPAIAKSPPDVSDDFLAEVHAGTSVFGRLAVSPMLVLEQEAKEPKPVRSLPGHFTIVHNASKEDISRIFGQEGETGKKYFSIGEPLDMENTAIPLDLEHFVERSSGVFGKSGTGKTFLCRLLLAGIIQKQAAVNLIFDMHNEYGWKGEEERTKTNVKGLKQLFESQVAIFTLDDESSRRRGARPDFVVRISYDQIEPEDVIMLSGLLGLTEVMVNTLRDLGEPPWGKQWLRKLLELDTAHVEELARSRGLHSGSLQALVAKLRGLKRFGFLQSQVEDPSVQRILEYLQKGKSIVLEFGQYGDSEVAYVLVANYLTRRIHEEYVKRKEKSLGKTGDAPLPLVITIEEAHKFLDPQIARDTIFGKIARELRKYNVTLLVVDQRPSGIDEEVMSQIGTRVICLLDNERDIQAVLAGISGAGELRQVLARLDSKQQALILGYAVRMPIAVKTRTYGEEFYKSVGYVSDEDLDAQFEKNRKMLRGENESDGF